MTFGFNSSYIFCHTIYMFECDFEWRSTIAYISTLDQFWNGHQLGTYIECKTFSSNRNPKFNALFVTVPELIEFIWSNILFNVYKIYDNHKILSRKTYSKINKKNSTGDESWNYLIMWWKSSTKGFKWNFKWQLANDDNKVNYV